MYDLKETVLIGNEKECTQAYNKLKDCFNLVSFVNDDLSGEWLLGKCFITFNQMLSDNKSKNIIICDIAYYAIGDKLRDNSIYDYYVFLNGFLYHTGLNETMQPVEMFTNNYIYDKRIIDILFVVDNIDDRVCSYAKKIVNRGYRVTLMYLHQNSQELPECLCDTFHNVVKFTTMNGYCKFLKNNDFNLVHCLCESSILANLLIKLNKPLVYEKQVCENKKNKMEAIVLDYIVNNYATAYVYTSNKERDDKYNEYSICNDKNMVVTDKIIEEPDFADRLSSFYLTLIDEYKSRK